jgi:hypothetical protein
MGWVTTGAAYGTMLTGLSVATATAFWVRARFREWRDARDARRDRNWNGFIIRESVPTWIARVVDEDGAQWSERVILDVVNPDGTPNPAMAQLLRQVVRNENTLTRSPSVAQAHFLDDLRRARFGAPSGYPIL